MSVRSSAPTRVRRDEDETEDLYAGSATIGTPIPRKHLDTARRPARVVFGAAFVAYSSIGTILGVGSDLAPALEKRADGAILGYVVGVVLAAVIFIAELLLAEVSTFGYILVLIPDTWYTYRFSGWIEPIVRAHVGDPLVATATTIVVTGLFSLFVAYAGERMLFGKRRR
jgi:hypothetical protein